MDIIVCMKPVPDPDRYSLITIHPDTKRLVRDSVPTIINPADKNALEAALRIRDDLGGTVIVVSMAPLFSQDKLKECLAMGADEAYLISDPAFGGSDTWSTSYILAQAIKIIDFKPDLIFAGHESADGATAHVPSQLGEWLGFNHISNVISISASDSISKVRKRTENGYVEYAVNHPAVIGISRNCNVPRMVNALGIVKAKGKKTTLLAKEDLDLDEDHIGQSGSPTQPGEIFLPDTSRKSVKLHGTSDEISNQILDLLRKAGANIDIGGEK